MSVKSNVMGDIFQILIFIIIGLVLLWFGYNLFFGHLSPFYPYLPWNKKRIIKGKPGDPAICPVCSMKMLRGELVKTFAYAARPQSKDRIMNIKGCRSCLEKDLPRRCPICRAKLSIDDYLISRMFERKYQKNHIHILGCNKCRKR